MRPLVPLVFLVATLALPVALPGSVTDECANAGPGCIAIPSQSTTPGGPSSPTLYLYLRGTMCAPGFNPTCTGAGYPNAKLVGFDGVLYEETNGIPGLQRAPLQSPHIDADTMLLL